MNDNCNIHPSQLYHLYELFEKSLQANSAGAGGASRGIIGASHLKSATYEQ
jgi:hypothetical protein